LEGAKKSGVAFNQERLYRSSQRRRRVMKAPSSTRKVRPLLDVLQSGPQDQTVAVIDGTSLAEGLQPSPLTPGCKAVRPDMDEIHWRHEW
jgi:hypothetical protein